MQTIVCEGLVVRRTKTTGGRSMVMLITDKCGKLSFGTHLSERSKSASALAIRPFVRGRYELRKGAHSYTLVSAEAKATYLELAGDLEKFGSASLMLELTSKALPEDAPSEGVYGLLITFIDLLSKRSKSYDTLVCAYLVKLLGIFGVLPSPQEFAEDKLLRKLSSGIVEVVEFMRQEPLESLVKLALEDSEAAHLRMVLQRYAELHLDVTALKAKIPMEV